MNYQNEEIKERGTENMSIVTNGNREPEIISKESPKYSKAGDNPKEWSKGQYVLWRKRIVKVRSFSEAMISDMYDLLKPNLKPNPDYIILHIGINDASKNTSNELLDKVLALKSFVTSNNKNIKVTISTLSKPVNDQKCGQW